MNKFEVVSRFTDKNIELPKRSTAYSAGYDLAVAEDIVIPPIMQLMDDLRNYNSGALTLAEMAAYTKRTGAKPTLVSTGLKCQIDEGWYLKLVVRSSLPLKHWLILANSEGVIDGDYYNNPDNEGEIFLQLINLSPFPIKLQKGDKIGQGIFVPWGVVENDLYGTGHRRTGGFGSTSEQTQPLTPIDPKELISNSNWADHTITLNDLLNKDYNWITSTSTFDDGTYTTATPNIIPGATISLNDTTSTATTDTEYEQLSFKDIT